MPKEIKENQNEALTPSKNERYELLSKFIDATINKDEEGIASSINKVITLKARAVLNPAAVTEHAAQKLEDEEDEDSEDEADSKYAHLLKTRAKKKAPLKKMKKDKELSEAESLELNKAALREFTGEGSPIRLKGDDVFVNGKLVGHIVNDLNDIDSGIVFQSADGKFKKDFDTIRDVYAFLLQHFKVAGETPLEVDEE